MTDPKKRSLFLPIMLIVVGLMVVAGVVFVFVPMVKCGYCNGLGYLTEEENAGILGGSSWELDDVDKWECEYCLASGMVNLRQNWESEGLSLGQFTPITFMAEEDAKRIKRNRRSKD